MVVWYAIKVVLPWRVSRWYTLYTSVNIALEVGSSSKVYTYLRSAIIGTFVCLLVKSICVFIGQVHWCSLLVKYICVMIGQAQLYGDMVKLHYVVYWSSTFVWSIGQVHLCGDMVKFFCVVTWTSSFV